MHASLRIALLLVLVAASTNTIAINLLQGGDFTGIGSLGSWHLAATNGGVAGYESSAGAPAGGCLRLQSFVNSATAHADQCVDVHKWTTVDFVLRKFNDGEGGGGTHPFKVDFYDTAACGGSIVGTITLPDAGTPTPGVPDAWLESSISGAPVPPGAISAKVNLDTIAGSGGFSYYLIDTVRFGPLDEIFLDDLEGN